MEAIIGGATALVGGAGSIGTALGSMLGLGAPTNLVAGTAAETATAGAGLGSTALTVLQGAMGLGSALSAIGQGKAASASYQLQATQADAEATQEKIAGMQRTTALKRELLKAVGESDVVYAAGGTDVGAGVAADARRSAAQRASTEISVDRSLMDARIALAKARASGYRRLAGEAETGGLIGGLTAGAKTAFDIYKRG